MSRSGPLTGVKVLDLTRLLPGALCSVVFADLGADVLKVEEPGAGDYMRWIAPYSGAPADYGAMFSASNRNKRSMTLDLKDARGQDVLHRLVRDADVLLEGFRPGVADRLGAGYDELSAINPRLVYCSVSGYGQDGPYASRPGHDLNYLAASGILHLTCDDNGAPVLSGPQIADVWGGGLTGALAVVLALFERTTTERGRRLDISMLDGSTAGLVNHLPEWLVGGQPYRPGEMPMTGRHPFYGVYPASDGFVTIADYEEKFWRNTCEIIGRPDLADDHQASGARATEVRAELAAVFATRSRKEWAEEFAGKDSCFMPVLSPEEAAESEHFQVRELLVDVALGEGRERQLATPLTRFGDGSHSPAPSMGADTDDVLSEIGFTADDIAALRTNAVI